MLATKFGAIMIWLKIRSGSFCFVAGENRRQNGKKGEVKEERKKEWLTGIEIENTLGKDKRH